MPSLYYARRSLRRGGQTKWILLGLLTLALVAVFGSRFLFAGPSITSLRDQALNGATPQVQREAARQLADKGEEGLPSLREVARQSDNEEVIAVSMIGLARQYDDQCMDLFLQKLDDSSLTVRVAAAKACTKILGRNHHFPADGKASERERIREQMKKIGNLISVLSYTNSIKEI